MTPGYVTASFAINAGYFFVEALVLSRVATMIFVPAESGSASTVEMVTIDPQDLQAAQGAGLKP